MHRRFVTLVKTLRIINMPGSKQRPSLLVEQEMGVLFLTSCGTGLGSRDKDSGVMRPEEAEDRPRACPGAWLGLVGALRLELR